MMSEIGSPQALLLSVRRSVDLYFYNYTKGGQVGFDDIQTGMDRSHVDHISLN